MTTYQDLGPRGPIYGVSDQNYQINPWPGLLGTGWVVVLDNNILASQLTGAEIYHIAVDGPFGSSLIVMRNGHKWDYVSQGFANGWDPSQALPLGSTQVGEIQFAWNAVFTSPPYSASNVQPEVTVWLRQPIANT